MPTTQHTIAHDLLAAVRLQCGLGATLTPQEQGYVRLLAIATDTTTTDHDLAQRCDNVARYVLADCL